MGFSAEVTISSLTVFLQGLLSFFSPCVLPMIPLYLGYLAGSAGDSGDADQSIRRRTFFRSLLFALGVCFAFFLLGFGFTTVGRFLGQNRRLLSQIGGILIVIFGLFQLGVFGNHFQNTARLPFRPDKAAMNPVTAFVLGFTFSFAWTPCVGPALASVLLMASSAGTALQGFALIGLYSLGFLIPFLAAGLFTSVVLEFFRKHRNVIRYTTKVGGVLLICMGILMATGWMNGLSAYLSNLGSPGSAPEQTPSSSQSEASPSSSSQGADVSSEETSPQAFPPAPGFTLQDQSGNTVSLSDFQGKTVYLNFMASWCGPCKMELPDLIALYEDHGQNQEDLVVIGVMNPRSAEYPQNADGELEEVLQFLSDNNVTYPVLMDTTGEVFQDYMISAFPTTYMIDKDGNVFGYITGALSREMMDNIVKQTMEGKRP